MPPKTRRAASGPMSKAGQSTLSFKNRVSKPAVTDSATALKNAKSQLNEPAQEIITSEIAKQEATPEPEEAPTTAKASGKGKVTQPESPVRIVPSPARDRKKKVRRSINDEDEDVTYNSAEKKARSVSDAAIKKYWKAQEDSRLAPRGNMKAQILVWVCTNVLAVHQKDVHMHEKILRHFDLSDYGPCIGISRLARWKRAHGLSMEPPVEVLAVILKEESLAASKRNTGIIAYVDELGGGREVEVTA